VNPPRDAFVIYGKRMLDPVALGARLLGDLPILLVLAMIFSLIGLSHSCRRPWRGNVVSAVPKDFSQHVAAAKISVPAAGGVITG